jgi:hypothetical protein
MCHWTLEIRLLRGSAETHTRPTHDLAWLDREILVASPRNFAGLRAISLAADAELLSYGYEGCGVSNQECSPSAQVGQFEAIEEERFLGSSLAAEGPP